MTPHVTKRKRQSVRSQPPTSTSLRTERGRLELVGGWGFGYLLESILSLGFYKIGDDPFLFFRQSTTSSTWWPFVEFLTSRGTPLLQDSDSTFLGPDSQILLFLRNKFHDYSNRPGHAPSPLQQLEVVEGPATPAAKRGAPYVPESGAALTLLTNSTPSFVHVPRFQILKRHIRIAINQLSKSGLLAVQSLWRPEHISGIADLHLIKQTSAVHWEPCFFGCLCRNCIQTWQQESPRPKEMKNYFQTSKRQREMALALWGTPNQKTFLEQGLRRTCGF